jgi:hypothetical protein
MCWGAFYIDTWTISPPTTTTIEIWTRSLCLLFLKELSTLLSSLPKQGKVAKKNWVKKKKKERINLGEEGGGEEGKVR